MRRSNWRDKEFLTAGDVASIMQYSRDKAYTMLNVMEAQGLAYRDGRTIRVHRVKFAAYVGIPDSPILGVIRGEGVS